MTVPPLLGTSIEGRDLVLAEWVDDGESSADRPVAPLHRHDADDEAWYVLDGSLGFVFGDERVEVPAGSALLVPHGVAHTFWNAGPGRVRYLIVMTPRIAALVRALHEPGGRDDVPALFRRFASELLA
jgi:oxalate decarboxylase/phosphoglucose isomerase-like protein (cupin superfamily)